MMSMAIGRLRQKSVDDGNGYRHIQYLPESPLVYDVCRKISPAVYCHTYNAIYCRRRTDQFRVARAIMALF